jgi:hypothetical protein
MPAFVARTGGKVQTVARPQRHRFIYSQVLPNHNCHAPYRGSAHAWEMKRGRAMLGKLIYAMGGLLLASAAAMAADLPLKAPVPRAPLFYGGSGFYWGVEAGATQTKLGGTAGTGVNVYSAGGTLSGTLGWTRAVGADRWMAVEASVTGSNADASVMDASGASVNVKRKYSFDITGMYGAPASVLAGIFSNADVAFGGLPMSPCGGALACIASNVHPFILGGLRYGRTTSDISLAPGLAALEESHNKLRVKAGVGTLVQVTNSTVWRTTADWTFGTQSKGAGFLFVPGASVNEGGTVSVKSGLFYAF